MGPCSSGASGSGGGSGAGGSGRGRGNLSDGGSGAGGQRGGGAADVRLALVETPLVPGPTLGANHSLDMVMLSK